MHGLKIRWIHYFLRDSYGPEVWQAVSAGTPFERGDFDVLRDYPDFDAGRLIGAICVAVKQPVPDLLEDMGAYLISHPTCANVRRLLRFGGETFVDFLHSLPELQDHTEIAVSGLGVPRLELRRHFAGNYSVSLLDAVPGTGFVVAGILRAMADDYGALVMLENIGTFGRTETISVQVLDLNFSAANDFSFLAAAS